MAKEETKPQEISMKNTKTEMIKAYNEVLELLKEKRAAELKPDRVIEEKKIQEVVEVADSLSTEGVAQEVSTLRLEIGRLLGDLSDRLEGEVNRYRQVKQAVEVRKNELEEIYGIEKSALSLAALIEAQHQRRQQTEAELTERKEKLTLEIETLRANWKQEKETYEAEIKERDADEQKRREREREEYTYTFQREQQLAGERFEDEQARQERELANRREQMESELADRERTIIEHENELRELREQVSAFPQELETAVSSTVAEATQRIEADASYREELLKREFDGERNVLVTRTESLEKTVAEQGEQIARLSQQVENAYNQVQDIATKAIEGASQAQTIGNLQQLMAEQSRQASKES